MFATISNVENYHQGLADRHALSGVWCRLTDAVRHHDAPLSEGQWPKLVHS